MEEAGGFRRGLREKEDMEDMGIIDILEYKNV